MIEIDIGTSPQQLKKLARRYAMTGGYELALRTGLGKDDLEQLAEIYAAELRSGSFSDRSQRRNSNAFRLLELILKTGMLSEETTAMLDNLLYCSKTSP